MEQINWLLLRGLTRESRHWGGFPEVFERSSPYIRAHCLDLPGVGTELLRDSPVNISGIREDVRARWLRLKETVSGDWFVFGISLGGMVSLDWVHSYPQDFRGAVLLNSSASNVSPPYRRLNFKNVMGLAQAGLLSESFRRERMILDFTTNMLPDPDALAAQFAAIGADSLRLGKTFARQLLAAVRYRAPRKVTTPLLILTSARDRFTDPSCSFRLARRFHAPLRMHPQAGHDVSLDDPQWVADEILNWMQKKAIREP